MNFTHEEGGKTSPNPIPPLSAGGLSRGYIIINLPGALGACHRLKQAFQATHQAQYDTIRPIMPLYD